MPRLILPNRSLYWPRSQGRTRAPLGAALGLCALLGASSVAAQSAQPAPAPQSAAPSAQPGFPPPPPSAPPSGSATTPPAGNAVPGPPPPPPAGAAPQGGYPQGPYPQGYGPYGPYPYPPPAYYGQAPYYYDPVPPPPPTKRNNPALMGLGIAMTATGTIGLLSGLAVLASGNNRIDVYCDGGQLCGNRDDTGMQLAGGVMMIVSGITAGVGIPLWVIGARRVPASKDESAPPSSEQTAARATLHLEPGGASLHFTF